MRLLIRMLILVGVLLLQGVGVSAQSTSGSPSRPATPPAAFSPQRLARIDAVLQQYVDENRIAGAVALVLRDGRTVYERAIGWSDKEAGRRVATNTSFRIAQSRFEIS